MTFERIGASFHSAVALLRQGEGMRMMEACATRSRWQRWCILPLAGMLLLASCISSGPGPDAAFFHDSPDSPDLVRLGKLWNERMQEDPYADFPIGPGDQLSISVTGLEEVQNSIVRVTADGTVTLPLIGQIQAGGLTEAELRELLRRRLTEDVMYDPSVTLSVVEYRSRLVGVIGSVTQPGFYPLTNDHDTILDVIALAGGMTIEAGPRIQFLPAANAQPPPVQLASATSAADAAKLLRDDPIPIDVRNLTQGGGNQVYLNMPTRPGDVIIVPERGEVLVEGWVANAGAYPISSGLTLIGSVAAAGGPHFGGNPASVRIIRSNETGTKLVYRADIKRIEAGKDPDVSVRPGDVVRVNASVPKATLWGVYRAVLSMVNIALVSR